MAVNNKNISFSDLIGKPYREGGRGPDYFDCWGLCMEVARRAGQKLPDLDVVISDDARGILVEEQKKGNFIKIDKPVPFCIILFRIPDDNNYIKWHSATILQDCKSFINITGKTMVSIVKLDHPFWSMFVEGLYIYEG